MQLQRIGAVMPSTSPCEGEDLHGDGRWMAMVGRFEISVFIIVVLIFITVIIIITNPTVLLSLCLPSIFPTKWRHDMMTKGVNMIPHCSAHGHVYLYWAQPLFHQHHHWFLKKERKKDGIKAKVGTRSSWRQIDCMSWAQEVNRRNQCCAVPTPLILNIQPNILNEKY